MLYPQYLQTKHWKDTRIKKLDTANHCQFCNTTSKLKIEKQVVYYLEKIQMIYLHFVFLVINYGIFIMEKPIYDIKLLQKLGV
jgi:hypothetical protein